MDTTWAWARHYCNTRPAGLSTVRFLITFSLRSTLNNSISVDPFTVITILEAEKM